MSISQAYPMVRGRLFQSYRTVPSVVLIGGKHYSDLGLCKCCSLCRGDLMFKAYKATTASRRSEIALTRFTSLILVVNKSPGIATSRVE